MREKSRKVALAGVLTAVAVTLMAIGSIVTVLDMSSAYAAGFAVIIAMIEHGVAASFGVYAASGFLALVLLPDKFAAVAFLSYGGIYPIVKSFCEKIKSKLLSYALKLLASNILLSAMIWLGRYFITSGDDQLGFEVWVYLLGNFVFVVYDMALTLIISKYYTIFRHKGSLK